jgi:hypothetical protein
MNPQDAIKDRGETDPERCPDCWHDVEDCVCEDLPVPVLANAENIPQGGRSERQSQLSGEARESTTEIPRVGNDGADSRGGQNLSLDKTEATTQWFDEKEQEANQ